MGKTSYLIALGSNRRHGRHGAPAKVVEAAAARLRQLGTIERISKVRPTPALGPAGRAFANAAVQLRTGLEPEELLDALKRIEREFGRRPGRRWGARVLDLDIILWSGGPWGGPAPLLPHPEFRNRRFVLEPLAEIAPQWTDPLTGRTVRQLLHRLSRPVPVDRALPRS